MDLVAHRVSVTYLKVDSLLEVWLSFPLLTSQLHLDWCFPSFFVFSYQTHVVLLVTFSLHVSSDSLSTNIPADSCPIHQRPVSKSRSQDSAELGLTPIYRTYCSVWSPLTTRPGPINLLNLHPSRPSIQHHLVFFNLHPSLPRTVT